MGSAPLGKTGLLSYLAQFLRSETRSPTLGIYLFVKNAQCTYTTFRLGIDKVIPNINVVKAQQTKNESCEVTL